MRDPDGWVHPVAYKHRAPTQPLQMGTLVLRQAQRLPGVGTYILQVVNLMHRIDNVITGGLQHIDGLPDASSCVLQTIYSILESGLKGRNH